MIGRLCRPALIFAAAVAAPVATIAQQPGAAPPVPPPDIAIQKAPPLDRPVRERGGRYHGPIADVHVHVFDRRSRLDLAAVRAQMQKAGVRRMFVMPTPNEGWYDERDANAEARREFVGMAGGAVARFCGSTYLTVWMNRAYRNGYEADELAERLARLRRDLAGGGCRGIGEIGPDHFEKRAGQMVLSFPMTFAPMVQLAQLAARAGVWLDMHAEPVTPDGRSVEAQVFGGIAHLFRTVPGLRIVLSHTGMTSPANARALLKTYPGLMMNLKIQRPGADLAWNNLGPIVNEDGVLYEDWARLFEEMPDRFMVGSDARFGTRQYGGDRYLRRIKGLRGMLGRLAPAAAEMIAWGNAARLWPAAQTMTR